MSEWDDFVVPESAEKVADCLERVADDHSGCFSPEDAFAVECAIARLRSLAKNTDTGGEK